MTAILAHFHKGEVLIVRPHDQDDPEANARAGQHCRFVRYGVSGYAQVQFDGAAKPFYFRPQDLQLVQGEL